jgi:hypothetical protein
MPNALAISLLRTHADSMARASAALVKKLRPTYERVPDASLIESVKGTLLGVATYLEKGDDKPLIDIVEKMINERRSSGLDALDFAVMSHCYLPPVRQTFVTRAPSPQEGLAAYDEVESVSLPLVEKLLRTAVGPTNEAQFLVPLYVRDVIERTFKS